MFIAIARHHPDSVQQQAIQSIQDDMNIDDELEIAGVGVPVKNRHPTRRGEYIDGSTECLCS